MLIGATRSDGAALLGDIYESFHQAWALRSGAAGARPQAGRHDRLHQHRDGDLLPGRADARQAAHVRHRAARQRGGQRRSLQEDVEALLASIEIPQLILHVRLLQAALTEVGHGGLPEGRHHRHRRDGTQHPVHPRRGQAEPDADGQDRGGLRAHRPALPRRAHRGRPHLQGAETGRDDRLQGGGRAGGARVRVAARGRALRQGAPAAAAAVRGAAGLARTIRSTPRPTARPSRSARTPTARTARSSSRP